MRPNEPLSGQLAIGHRRKAEDNNMAKKSKPANGVANVILKRLAKGEAHFGELQAAVRKARKVPVDKRVRIWKTLSQLEAAGKIVKTARGVYEVA